MRSRVHRRVHMDYVGVKRFDRDGKLIGEFRIVGLFTSTAYTRSTRTIPYLRRKVDAVLRARRLRSRRPFRQGAGQRAGDLSARRAVPDRRGHALSFRAWRSCSSTSGRACACWRGATASTASSRSSSTCRASATTATCARRSAIISPSVYKGRVSAFYPFFPGRPAGARAFHHRPLRRATTPNPDRATLEARGRARSCAPGPTSSARSSRAVYDPVQGARAVRALSRCVLRRLSRSLFAGRRPSPTSGSSKGLSPDRPLGVDFHRRAGRSTATPSG